MNRKDIILTVTILCMVLLSYPIVLADGIGAPWGLRVDEVVFDKESYTDGYVGSCTLTVSNTGDFELKLTEVEMRTSFGNFTWTGELTVLKGTQSEIEISFRVPIGTEAGEYSLEFYFKLGYSWQGRSEEGSWKYTIEKKLEVKKAPSGALGNIPGFPLEGIITGMALAIFILLGRRRRAVLTRSG